MAITLATKTLAACAIEDVHSHGDSRAMALRVFKSHLKTIGEAGTNDTLIQVAELIADSPNVGASDDWWQP